MRGALMMGARAIHAAAATDRLRDEEPPWGIDVREAICPACALAFWEAAGAQGVCSDCGAETCQILPF